MELLALGNFTGESVEVDLLDADCWRQASVLLTNVEHGEDVRLLPWEARVLRREIVS